MSTDQTRQPTRPGRVTIRTVAADAGVSVAAVSKVLRNAYGVSEALRLKVAGSIERLGYRPNVAARGMRGQTFTIGILLVEIANPFLPEVIDGINAVLGPSNYQAMFAMGESRKQLEATMIETMIDYRMDGLILVAPQLAGETLARFAAQIPIVALGHHEPTADSFDTINSDDREGAAIAVRAMLQTGLRDVTMISLDETENFAENVSKAREVGYLEAMAAAGLADRTRILRFPPQSPDRAGAVTRLLNAPDRPRAIFCWSDLDAVPILNAAKTMGLAIPGDLAIVGYDNSPVAALPLIDLASIDQAGRRLGALAAETLLSRIKGRRVPNHFMLEPTLVRRSSLQASVSRIMV